MKKESIISVCDIDIHGIFAEQMRYSQAFALPISAAKAMVPNGSSLSIQIFPQTLSQNCSNIVSNISSSSSWGYKRNESTI